MTAILDIQENARISRDKNGYRVDRIAIVESVTGNADERLFNAINDAQLPDFGDAHPVITDIYLNDISADVIDPETVRVTLSYYDDPDNSESGSATTRASGTTAIEEVKLDTSGNAMVTRYAKGAFTFEERFSAEVERPRVTFDFEYSSSSFPQSTIDTYLGKINSAIWNGYPIKTILCTAVNVSQQGSEYSVTVSFAHNVDTWVFKARTSKSPVLLAHPTDPDASLDLINGVRDFEVYTQVDFTPLGLTL